VSLLVLYLLMLKATVTTLNGPMSLPILRDELVVKHRVVTDKELSAAVTAAQSSPGPMGIYVVSVGFFVAGLPGAAAGLAALLTPAFLAIPLIRWIGRRLNTPRARRTLNAAMLASAGLILTSAIPLAEASVHTWTTAGIAAAACVLVASTRIPTVFLIATAGVVGFLAR
jgi:chromate transporter